MVVSGSHKKGRLNDIILFARSRLGRVRGGDAVSGREDPGREEGAVVIAWTACSPMKRLQRLSDCASYAKRLKCPDAARRS